jgi:hypothetical protein
MRTFVRFLLLLGNPLSCLLLLPISICLVLVFHLPPPCLLYLHTPLIAC